MTDTKNYKEAFAAFKSIDIRVAIREATKLVNSSIYVELFDDGNYRVVYSVGNRYDTPGMMIGIPGVSDEEWDDDCHLIFYENAINEIETKFEQKMLDLVDGK